MEREQIGTAAMEAMDELPDQGEFVGVAVIVAANHQGEATINYRFKNAQGGDLATPLGLVMLGKVIEAIGRQGGA